MIRALQSVRNVRNYLLASVGFCVISIDSRGSSNRGKDFEGHIYERLGQVELEDQLEVLNSFAKDNSFLDLERVAISGWSYGGYLALNGLMRFPEKFKVNFYSILTTPFLYMVCCTQVAIAGAPVTDWGLYDSAYTERYMNLPYENPLGYEGSSILKNAFKLPDE